MHPTDRPLGSTFYICFTKLYVVLVYDAPKKAAFDMHIKKADEREG